MLEQFQILLEFLCEVLVSQLDIVTLLLLVTDEDIFESVANIWQLGLLSPATLLELPLPQE